jgi:hypothetical protein
MKDLNDKELKMIEGGFNQEAYDAGHAVGDFVGQVIGGVLH